MTRRLDRILDSRPRAVQVGQRFVAMQHGRPLTLGIATSVGATFRIYAHGDDGGFGWGKVDHDPGMGIRVRAVSRRTYQRLARAWGDA